MEKLIELLNQYEEEKKSDNHWGLTYDNELIGLGNIREARLSVISKEYGFIKWLVDNDKIDRSKVLKEIGGCIKISGLGPHYSFYSALLMILAVSDTPIDFLCEIIK